MNTANGVGGAAGWAGSAQCGCAVGGCATGRACVHVPLCARCPGRGLCLFSLSTAISGSPRAPLFMQLVQLGHGDPALGWGVGGASLGPLSPTPHSGFFLDSGPACSKSSGAQRSPPQEKGKGSGPPAHLTSSLLCAGLTW